MNLKNDFLRRKVDAFKYDVQRVENVVYDLTIRGVKKPQEIEEEEEEKKEEGEGKGEEKKEENNIVD